MNIERRKGERDGKEGGGRNRNERIERTYFLDVLKLRIVLYNRRVD